MAPEVNALVSAWRELSLDGPPHALKADLAVFGQAGPLQ